MVFAEVVVELEVTVVDFVVVLAELTNFPSFPSLKYVLIYYGVAILFFLNLHKYTIKKLKILFLKFYFFNYFF